MSELVNTPTIDWVFSNLTGNLQILKSCSIINLNGISFPTPDDIEIHIYSFPSKVAIPYISISLKQIEDVRSLGNKVIRNIRLTAESDMDEEWQYRNPDAETDFRKKTMASIVKYLDMKEAMLFRLRKDIISRDALLTEEAIKNQEILLSQNSKSASVKISPKQKPIGSYDSFRYNDYDTKPDNIKQLCKALINKGFIDKKTSVSDFKKIFSGKKIGAPIKWIGNISELVYFIKLIHTILKKVEPAKQQHFKITALCFVQPKGTSFDWAKMRWQKKPSKAAELEKLANLL